MPPGWPARTSPAVARTTRALRELRRTIRADIARDAGGLLRDGQLDHAVATSKTFRSLSRICGAAPSNEGLFVRRMLPATTLESWIPKLLEMSREEIAGAARASPRTGRTRSSRAHSWRRR